MNDVSNRAVREFSEFLNSIEADFPKPTCTTAYEITMKSTIVSALITLDTENRWTSVFGTISGCSGTFWISCIPCGWMMTVPWWMSFPPLSKTWWNMISLSQKNS